MIDLVRESLEWVVVAGRTLHAFGKDAPDCPKMSRNVPPEKRSLRPGGAGSPWELPPRAPTDPDVPDSGIRLVKGRIGSYAYTEWTTRAGGNG